jgi:hypothetical protein
VNARLRVYHSSIASLEFVLSWIQVARRSIDGGIAYALQDFRAQPYDLLEKLSEIASDIQLSRPHSVIKWLQKEVSGERNTDSKSKKRGA